MKSQCVTCSYPDQVRKMYRVFPKWQISKCVHSTVDKSMLIIHSYNSNLSFYFFFISFFTDHQKLEREARICRLLKHPNIGQSQVSYQIILICEYKQPLPPKQLVGKHCNMCSSVTLHQKANMSSELVVGWMLNPLTVITPISPIHLLARLNINLICMASFSLHSLWTKVLCSFRVSNPLLGLSKPCLDSFHSDLCVLLVFYAFSLLLLVYLFPTQMPVVYSFPGRMPLVCFFAGPILMVHSLAQCRWPMGQLAFSDFIRGW